VRGAGQAEIVSDVAEAGKRRARRLQFVTLGEGIIPRIQETSTLGARRGFGFLLLR
jgi:hypothetical protein